jgi:hypothetical protein
VAPQITALDIARHLIKLTRIQHEPDTPQKLTPDIKRLHSQPLNLSLDIKLSHIVLMSLNLFMHFRQLFSKLLQMLTRLVIVLEIEKTQQLTLPALLRFR